MKHTQRDWVIRQLRAYGEVSRNGALQNFISRLGAIINDLKKEGWEFGTHYREEKGKKDFIYKLIDSPYEKVEYFIPGINKTVTRYE